MRRPMRRNTESPFERKQKVAAKILVLRKSIYCGFASPLFPGSDLLGKKGQRHNFGG